MVLLQHIDGRQELLERSPVQSWLAVRAGWFSLHFGGEPRTRDADTGSAHPIVFRRASRPKFAFCTLIPLYKSAAVVEWLMAVQQLGFRL